MIIINILGYLSLLLILIVVFTIIIQDKLDTRKAKKEFEKGRILILEEQHRDLHKKHYELKADFVKLKTKFENS